MLEDGQDGVHLLFGPLLRFEPETSVILLSVDTLSTALADGVEVLVVVIVGGDHTSTRLQEQSFNLPVHSDTTVSRQDKNKQ